MNSIILNLTDDQVTELMSLASALRAFLDKPRPPPKRQEHPWQPTAPDLWLDVLRSIDVNRISSLEIMQRYIGQEVTRLSAYDGARIAACMRQLGWSGPKPLWIEGKAVRGYER